MGNVVCHETSVIEKLSTYPKDLLGILQDCTKCFIDKIDEYLENERNGRPAILRCGDKTINNPFVLLKIQQIIIANMDLLGGKLPAGPKMEDCPEINRKLQRVVSVFRQLDIPIPDPPPEISTIISKKEK